MEQYKDMAEARLVELRRQEEAANRKLLSLEWVVGILGAGAFFMGIFAGSMATMDMPWRALLIGGGSVLFLVAMACALKIERSAGYYECPKCGARYVPAMKAVFLAPHIGRTRWMKCPQCGRRAFQKKVLSR